jgi:hypothetical protein
MHPASRCFQFVSRGVTLGTVGVEGVHITYGRRQTYNNTQASAFRIQLHKSIILGPAVTASPVERTRIPFQVLLAVASCDWLWAHLDYHTSLTLQCIFRPTPHYQFRFASLSSATNPELNYSGRQLLQHIRTRSLTTQSIPRYVTNRTLLGRTCEDQHRYKSRRHDQSTSFGGVRETMELWR